MAASILFHGASTSRFFALLLILLVFVNKCYCHVQKDIFRYDLEEDPVKDFILCRKCGADIVDSGYIINNLSPEALVITNQTLFDNPGIDVQYLVNPFGIAFSTITLSTASCFGVNGHWNLLYSWYPGYAWKPCLCRHCGHQLGWMFEPVKSATANRLAPTNDGFYLLILDNLLSEKSSGTIIMGDSSMTEEQKEFLALCEEEFKDRYTDKDKEFMKIKSEDPSKPPIVDPWYNKPRRPLYDWSRQNREQGHGGRRNHHSDRRNNERNDRYDRHAGKHHLYQRNSRPY